MGTVERDITLAMSLKLEKELKSKGATVVMTRSKEGDAIAQHTPDVDYPTIRARKRADLLLREEIMNNSEADIVISLHVNAVPEEEVERRTSVLSCGGPCRGRAFG